MKKKLSLKLSIALSFLFLGILIVIAYSAISRHFFMLGMDNIMSANMADVAKSYIEHPTKRCHLNGFHISHDWQGQPENIQNIFTEPKQYNELHKYADSSFRSKPENIYFAIKLEVNGELLYISKRSNIDNAPQLIHDNIKQSRKQILIISISIIVGLILVTLFMMRRVSQPVSQLADWTNSLNIQTLNDTPPDFHYPELNAMAELIKNSLSSAQKSLEHEEQFLNFASHELRTPISTIRNNIELLLKMKKLTAQDINDSKFDQVIGRIDRASLTMKNLSETLLWLSRDNNDDLLYSSVSLNNAIKQIVQESRYLLEGKVINLSVSTEEGMMVQLPEQAMRIVIANLIRNAFQHTQKGNINITQLGRAVTIINDYEHFEGTVISNETGFGLGLQLSMQLSEKLGWSYQASHNQQQYTVILTF